MRKICKKTNFQVVKDFSQGTIVFVDGICAQEGHIKRKKMGFLPILKYWEDRYKNGSPNLNQEQIYQMAETEEQKLIIGEFSRKLDDRYRFSLPNEFLEVFQPVNGDCILAKERPGCISLWDQAAWNKVDDRLDLVKLHLKAGDLNKKIPDLQILGRLLSTRQRAIKLAGRGRLVLPEGFREFLRVAPEDEIMIVGAAVCIEIWNPKRWLSYTERRVSKFRKLLDQLSSGS